MSKSNKILTMVLIGVGLIALAIFIAIFANGNETRTFGEAENEKIEALVCRSAGREDGFFHSETANQIVNEIKATYSGDTFDKLYYSYEGIYRSEETAKGDQSMHTDYNIYMGKNNIQYDILSPSYSVVKNKYHLTLYADEEGDLNNTTAVFFYIDDKDLERFKKFDIDEMKKYYEDKNFKCGLVK